LGYRIPGPVGFLSIFEDDANSVVSIRCVAPDIKVSPWAIWRRLPRSLKPRVLIGSVVNNEFHDDAPTAFVGFMNQAAKVL
jgi:hypothetical protein